MNKPAVHYDPQSDVLYLPVRDGEAERFVDVSEGVSVELDRQGQLLGMEILNASRFLGAAIGPERLAQFARTEGCNYCHYALSRGQDCLEAASRLVVHGRNVQFYDIFSKGLRQEDVGHVWPGSSLVQEAATPMIDHPRGSSLSVGGPEAWRQEEIAEEGADGDTLTN